MNCPARNGRLKDSLAQIILVNAWVPHPFGPVEKVLFLTISRFR